MLPFDGQSVFELGGKDNGAIVLQWLKESILKQMNLYNHQTS
jgi:hypothetical protein